MTDKVNKAAEEYAFNNAEDGEEYNARYIGFLSGAEWDRVQMMEEVVEGKIIFLLNGDVAVNIGDTDEYKLGQKVRIIILKEN